MQSEIVLLSIESVDSFLKGRFEVLDGFVGSPERIALLNVVLVVEDDVPENSLLFDQLVDSLLVVSLLFSPLALHLRDLDVEGVDGVVELVGAFNEVSFHLLFPFPLSSDSLAYALIEDVSEGFEDVVEKKGPDEVPVLIVSVFEPNLLSVE